MEHYTLIIYYSDIGVSIVLTAMAAFMDQKWFILVIIFGFIYCYQNEEEQAKPVLDITEPKELLNYTRREKLGKQISSLLKDHLNKKIHVKAPITTVQCSTAEALSTEEEDNDALDMRKIWSRWGKWGRCSVTCGEGVITRRRTCVTGRCAPGEFEEQIRPCCRAPCLATADHGEDLRDSD